jgi:hypothetical protein
MLRKDRGMAKKENEESIPRKARNYFEEGFN